MPGGANASAPVTDLIETSGSSGPPFEFAANIPFIIGGKEIDYIRSLCQAPCGGSWVRQTGERTTLVLWPYTLNKPAGRNKKRFESYEIRQSRRVQSGLANRILKDRSRVFARPFQVLLELSSPCRVTQEFSRSFGFGASSRRCNAPVAVPQGPKNGYRQAEFLRS